MTLWEFTEGDLRVVDRTSFESVGMRERQDLQRVLRDNIDALIPDVLIIAEEFQDWESSKDRIDLLGIDSDANIVVIELKRTESGGHADLQAIRYAAMVSTMTFEQAVRAYAKYLEQRNDDAGAAREQLLQFLGWEEPK